MSDAHPETLSARHLRSYPFLQVAVAALSSLAEVVKTPSCSRLFENYLDKILPLVFARFIDSKDNIRQAASRVLDVSNRVGSVSSTLPLLDRRRPEHWLGLLIGELPWTV